MNARILNAISVDVEDWLQSVIDPRLPLTDRFRANTYRVLDAFARHDVHGTFFVLGLAAEKAPELVREIRSAGHEVQSHGYGHELIHTLDRRRFRADVEHARKLLEDITGNQVCGYRAPAFTITRRTLWALDVLVETGHRFDSSIFPIRMPRYGIDAAPRFPHRLRTPAGYEITEVPVATLQLGGRRLPTGGGGYFRLLPAFLLRRGIAQLNEAGRAATIYLHPYEYAPGETRAFGHPVSWKKHLHQSLGRRGFPRKVDRLLRAFRFGTISEMVACAAELPQVEYGPAVDSGPFPACTR